MLPAAVLLLLFLTYPLGLGTWLGFTDTKIGRPGVWVGLENFKYLVSDHVEARIMRAGERREEIINRVEDDRCVRRSGHCR